MSVFTRNRKWYANIADDSRPSSTICGIPVKLLSSKTRLAMFFAASLPRATEMLQSASFKAMTSLTPSLSLP